MNQKSKITFQVCTLQAETSGGKLKETLELIIAILEQYLNNEWSKRDFRHLPDMLFKTHNLQQAVATSISTTTRVELYYHMAQILCLINFITLCVDSKEQMITEQEATPIFGNIFQLIETTVSKKSWEPAVKLCHLGMKYWFLIRSRLLSITSKDTNKDPLQFQNQLVWLHILPIYATLMMHFGYYWKGVDKDDTRESYVDKYTRQASEGTIRLAYAFREMLENIPDDYEIGIKSLHYILDSRKYYTRETAIVVFQSFVYQLKDVILCLSNDKRQVTAMKKETIFFYTLIYATKKFVEVFDITWTDCMESVCVTDATIDFILLKKWPTKVPSLRSVAFGSFIKRCRYS